MQTTRRAVRPEGQYYRNSRRQRLARSLSEDVASPTTVLSWIIFAALAAVLLCLAWYASGWFRLAAVGGAGISLILTVFTLTTRRD
jgi:hypothetical protein